MLCYTFPALSMAVCNWQGVSSNTPILRPSHQDYDEAVRAADLLAELWPSDVAVNTTLPQRFSCLPVTVAKSWVCEGNRIVCICIYVD